MRTTNAQPPPTGGDLGIFDQAAYLISVGAPPISSIMGYHILGDHAAPIWYVLALPYRLHPSAYWLLLIQSAALAIGAWPMFKLARHSGASDEEELVLSVAYLLYPVLYNVNLDDFHPEVISVPVILASVMAARMDRVWWFCAGVLLILSCKAVLGVTVFGMGFWLFLFERKRRCGAIAMIAGLGWFAFATLVVIPAITGSDAAVFMGDNRYAWLGGSVKEIVYNTLTRPWLLSGYVFSVSTLGYVAGLVSPVLWGLTPRCLAPLLAAVPAFTLNVLSDWRMQRHLTNQYSVPIFPFLLIAVLAAFAAGRTWVRNPRIILAWSVLGFLIFARYPRIVRYLGTIDTWRSARDARGRGPDRQLPCAAGVTHSQPVHCSRRAR